MESTAVTILNYLRFTIHDLRKKERHDARSLLQPNSNEVNELYLLGAGAAGAGACTLTLTFVPPPPNNRPLNANKTTTTMITKITKTATTPALPPPSPLSPMSSLLLWELRIQLVGGCGNDYHRHASGSIIVTEKERETRLSLSPHWTRW